MTIKAALLGYGRNGSTMHAGAMERNPGITVSAVCDIDQARLQQARDRFGCAVYTDYKEMLAQEQLDLVSVVTRSDQHCQMACDCLHAGVNVLVTKPWATTAAQARQIVQAAQASGQRVFPWLPSRFGSTLRALQVLVAEQAVGDIFLVRRINRYFGIRNDWQTERKYGGGYLLNWGPHLVDPPLVLMNQKIVSVYSCLRQVINPGDGEDIFLIVFTLANGCIVHVEQTVSTQPLPEWVIQGTKGTIIVNGNEIIVRSGAPAQPADATKYLGMRANDLVTSTQTVAGNQYGDENEIYAALYSALTEGKEYPFPPEDALNLSVILDNIRLSSETNKVVSW